MEKEYFFYTGIPPPLHFEPTMHTWNSFSAAPELNCSSDQTSPCFLNPNWDKQTGHFTQLESALSSMVSSPVAPTSALPNDPLALRELIGKLGPICNTGEISRPFPSASTTAASSYVGNNGANASCYSTPLNSPPKIQQLPIVNQFVKENLPNLANSVALSPPLPALSADPGFAERAAKLSCFGSRSFNGRTSLFGSNNAELPYRSATATMCNGKLPRVSSSPSLKQSGYPMENQNSGPPQLEMRPPNVLVTGSDKNFNKLPGNGPSSNEDSSVSEQVPSVETGSKTPTGLNSRKRKAVSRGKTKEDASTGAMNPNKGVETDDNVNSKRPKPTEADASDKSGNKSEEDARDGANKAREQDKANQKPPEPPKDYIHVRARRGQATDSHSLAERVRREKISERMKLLQDLVPGCNKVTGKALMLDEIINYVQSLQRQVEFLSMKLASVNPTLDFNMENLVSNSKDIVQPNAASLPHPLFPVDSSVQGFYNHQPQPQPQPQQNPQNNNCSVSHCTAEPIDTTLCRNLGLHLPPLDGFGEGLPQFPQFCEDDLQSIVQMGFGPGSDREPPFHSQSFPVTNRTSHMKIEL